MSFDDALDVEDLDRLDRCYDCGEPVLDCVCDPRDGYDWRPVPGSVSA